jgi:hypothetical protein
VTSSHRSMKVTLRATAASSVDHALTRLSLEPLPPSFSMHAAVAGEAHNAGCVDALTMHHCCCMCRCPGSTCLKVPRPPPHTARPSFPIQAHIAAGTSQAVTPPPPHTGRVYSSLARSPLATASQLCPCIAITAPLLPVFHVVHAGGFKLWEGAVDLCQYLVDTYHLTPDMLANPSTSPLSVSICSSHTCDNVPAAP